MAEIINLHRIRKRREREQASHDAAAVRAKHGQTRQQRDTATAAKETTRRTLDGARITPLPWDGEDAE
jgi:hypothetical protein